MPRITLRRLLAAAAGLAAVTATTAALASGGHPITEKMLAAAKVSEGYAFREDRPADVVLAKATVPAGASFGWHYHRADVVAMVTSGTLTLYDSADPSCTPKRYTAGQAFTEHRRHAHLARNESRTPAHVLVAYLGLKHGADPDVPATAPGNCSF